MTEAAKKIENPPFAFRRLGGMNQFVLQTDNEWRNLHDLDKKLWMALSCPTRGLEFSRETLELLDSDHDGRIRVQDVKDAVDWLCARLNHPSRLAEGQAEVELDNISTDTPAGGQLLNAAKIVLEKQNIDGSTAINFAELEKVVAEANSYPFNGDGIVPPDSAPLSADAPLPQNMEKFIRLAIGVIGAKRDASGKPGLDEDLCQAFLDLLKSAKDWRARLKKANLPLGENTAAIWTLFSEVHSKIDDYFCRCGLLAYAPEAAPQINDEQLFLQSTQSAPENNGLLSRASLENLPLAKANAKKALNLVDGINPVWQDRIAEFGKLVAPLANIRNNELEAGEWEKIKKAFGEYSAILADRPAPDAAPADAEGANFPGLPDIYLAPQNDRLGRAFLPGNPADALAAIDDGLLEEILAPATLEAFGSLVAKDKAAPPLAAFQELRKLALYHAHLYKFLNNFLSFTDFYTPEKKAIFQTGTLYLDGRACLLCVPVDNMDNHARLAEQSHLCLVYCECQRKNADGSDSAMTIAAALTEGNVARLIEGKHGLFIDDGGNEWDSRIVKIVHNPISLQEAVWAPYIRFANMISEQIHKFVEAKDKAVADKTTELAAAPPAEAAAAPAQKQPFDFAKSAGIFAALSVAVSMLSAAFAYIANSLASLGWLWPFAIVLIFICISGPSVILAWFKLRKRGLGSLLDASDWAVNNEAPINILMGATLTKKAKLPSDVRKELNDPYAVPEEVIAKRRRRRNWLIFWLIVLLCLAGFATWCWLIHTPEWLSGCWDAITGTLKGAGEAAKGN